MTWDRAADTTIAVPAFSISVELSKTAQAKLQAMHESVLVIAYFDGDPLPGKGKYNAPMRGVVLGSDQELADTNNVASFVDTKISQSAWNDLSDKDYYVTINVVSARKASENNLLDCSDPEDRISTFAGKATNVSCRLIGEVSDFTATPSSPQFDGSNSIVDPIVTPAEVASFPRRRVWPTSVCAIAADPVRFADRLVLVSGRYESDGIERSVLTDDKCRDKGIAVSTPASFDGEAAFTKALSSGYPGTLDKIVTGTFVGTFRWQPAEVPKRVLELREVRNLSVVMGKTR